MDFSEARPFAMAGAEPKERTRGNQSQLDHDALAVDAERFASVLGADVNS